VRTETRLLGRSRVSCCNVQNNHEVSSAFHSISFFLHPLAGKSITEVSQSIVTIKVAGFHPLAGKSITEGKKVISILQSQFLGFHPLAGKSITEAVKYAEDCENTFAFPSPCGEKYYRSLKLIP
jgi:hypothetical protein